MAKLKETILRKLENDKKEILDEFDKKAECYCAFKLFSEEGEVLITLLMSDEEIEKDAKEAVNEIFEGKDVMDMFVSRNREIISFTII